MEGVFKMRNGRKILMISFLTSMILFSLLIDIGEAKPNVYYGKVVATEGKMIQVKADNGKVAVFWLGHRTRFDSRVPLFGDRVRIEYVKDKLNRNAVTRVTLLGK
jgi:hypothetical protein